MAEAEEVKTETVTVTLTEDTLAVSASSRNIRGSQSKK